MRRLRALSSVSLVALLMIAGPACDTEQPMNGGEKPFTVGFISVSQAKIFDVWTLSEDQNGNGELDPGEDYFFNGELDEGVWCEDTGQTADADVPWSYSLRIDVTRSGATEPTTVYTSGGQSISYPNMTPYDTAVQATFPEKTVFIGERSWVVRDGERISQGNRRLLDAPFGFSPTPDFAPACLVNAQLGDPSIAGGPPPYSIQLNPGDTIQVQARKQPKAEAPVIFNPDPSSVDTPRMLAQPTLDGVSVSGTGNTVTTAEDKAGISFFVTLR